MTPLQMTVIAILEHAEAYEWSVQRFGMLRLYLRKVGRLHIWDKVLRYPDVSMVHNHSWDLESTIVFGRLLNTLFIPHPRYGDWYSGKRLITGYNTTDVNPLPDTRLTVMESTTYNPGDIYAQSASMIHRTDADDGTITLMRRNEDEKGQADVYWPQGTDWGTAKPRSATLEEVRIVSARALALVDA